MRILNNYYNKNNISNYPINVNKNSFHGVPAPVTGVFNKETQNSIQRLYENLESIHKLFLLFAHYPAKAIAIKEGYSGLSQKNRNQGLAFNLPEGNGSIIIRTLRSIPDALRLIVEKNGKVTSYLTHGTTRSVSNINQNNPQYLPRRFKYMTKEEIDSCGIEEYIKIADEEINKYNQYLEKYRSHYKNPELLADKKNNTNLTNEPIKEEVINPVKNIMAKFTKLFETPIDELPKKLTPILGTKNNIIGFSYKSSDESTVKITKKVNTSCNNMIYLSIEKILPDGSKSYLNIDISSYKFLKMKENGKLKVQNNITQTYSEAEVEKRKMEDKLAAYLEDIYAAPAQKEKIDTPKELPQEKGLQKQDLQNDTDLLKIFDTEKSRQMIISKAKKDADELSELYFETFIKQFKENMSKKIERLKNDFSNLFPDIK